MAYPHAWRCSPVLAAFLFLLGACDDSTDGDVSGVSGSIGGPRDAAGGTGGATGDSGPCELGSRWTLVDDFVFSPGEPSNPGAIAAGPAGEIYAGGTVRMGTFRGLLRKSADRGVTWTTLDVVDPVETRPIGASGIVVDPQGVVFAIGAVVGARVVWKSSDGGKSFARVDSVPIDVNSPCNTGSIARAPDGTLYTLGSCDLTGWIVRRGNSAGASWSTVSTFELAAGHRGRSAGVFVDATGRAFVSGSAQDMLDLNHWVVRSARPNEQWTTVDDYQLSMGAHAGAAELGGSSRLYALGAAATMPPDFTGSHWIVRTADPVTGAWSTADDYSPSTASTSRAHAIHEDRSGALLVFGAVADGTGAEAAVTRRSTDAGKSWQVVDTYSYVAGKPSAPTALTSDPDGNLYVMLRGVDAGDVAHWLVRKLACE